MTNEVTVPLLPCASIDDIESFYGVLGFSTTYKQRRPNPCVALQRETCTCSSSRWPGSTRSSRTAPVS
jgi:hypothetical protein